MTTTTDATATTTGLDATSTTLTPTASASPATTGTPVVLNIVEITRLMPAGTTAVTAAAVTVPTTAGVPTLAGTITQSDSSITGPLCVVPCTTTPLPLTTGIEFGPGQTVQLVNVPDATTTPAGTAVTAGGVAFHLRGMLVAG